ncbi:tRNA pseudouridine(38-40) synthase TruA [Paenibacillus antarcticus]|uniref:tRNA pseudouridine synthase A n=1 Tax=Paenibacillus antarcticus TaxID=253703 RepID=A0A168LYA8_9BACL|nr:tRNA pseudouridine(38-40) synthase TruA [Paenibacillus antarcticus]OAB43997.1 tRNA pseudouridine(38,39,40) synthase TruA [Paenibacillus antarcticus]
MRNLCMKVSYEGTNYNGFQTQTDGRTVQDHLEKAIKMLTGDEVKIIASGRTDAGVHAYGQVFNFHSLSAIPVERWAMALNTRLPGDIVVREAIEVPELFHSRRSAKRKTYRYTVNANQFIDVFARHTQFHHHGRLDISAMQSAIKYFIGTHDFTSFASRNSTKTCHVRTLFDAYIEVDDSMCRSASRDQGVIHTYVTGSGFLQHMVRIMMGTLLEVGEGKKSPDDIPVILAALDRTQAGPTAEGKGLTLWDVDYSVHMKKTL